MPTGQETRVTSETGGAKGVKLARFSLLPWAILREVAEHYGRGARKYEDRNWERGYKWSASFDALGRHLESFWNRDDIDDDSALYVEGEAHVARHIIAVVWHALCLAYFSRYGVGEDDRPQYAKHWLDEQEKATRKPESVLTRPQVEAAALARQWYDSKRPETRGFIRGVRHMSDPYGCATPPRPKRQVSDPDF